MPTPSERLANIISAYTPSEVVFKVKKSAMAAGDALTFEAVTIKNQEWNVNEADADLQLALSCDVVECWDHEQGKFYIDATVEKLWLRIKRVIIHQYEKTSPRCKATISKTEKFIRNIRIDDKGLPNFLIQTFLTISSAAYENKSRTEREALFEQFESLRRTYGKRDR